MVSTLKATKLFSLKKEVASSGVKPWPTIADFTQLAQQRHPEDICFTFQYEMRFILTFFS